MSLIESVANRALLEIEEHLQKQSLVLFGMPLPEDTTVPIAPVMRAACRKIAVTLMSVGFCAMLANYVHLTCYIFRT